MMNIGAVDLSLGLAPFSLGAHVDWSLCECQDCAVVHNVFGVSLGFVFVRVLLVVRVGCESND